MQTPSNEHDQISSNNPLQAAHKPLIFICTKQETATHYYTTMKHYKSALH